MSAPDDVEDLLHAVRALIAARPAAADPLLLTADQRVDATADQDTSTEDQGPGKDAVLRSFARLTRIAAAEVTAEPAACGAAPSVSGESQIKAVGLPDTETLRAIIGEVLRDELQKGAGRHLSEDLFRRLQAELDRRLGADPAG